MIELPIAKDTRDRYVVKIPRRGWYSERGVDIPPYVWQENKSTFLPKDFILEHTRLKNKSIDSDVQSKSLDRFIADPTAPCVYGVASEPSDAQALYFAAYLAYIHTLSKPQSVLWTSIQGNWKNKLIEDHDEQVGMLIISGLAENSSNIKFEKTRDLLVAYSHIPRIVVIGGEDPISFFSTKLHHKVTDIFFTSSALANRKHETV